MKRVNNIYQNICNLDEIIEMTNKVCSNVKNKEKIEKFTLYKSEHVINIYTKIINKDFSFSKYNIFLISDPKCRVVMAQNIEDKIINHLVAKKFLVDVFDKSYMDFMCATRVHKGTKYAINLLSKYINKIRIESKNFYYLKIDIKKYFYSIDHNILKNIIRRKIKDKSALECIDKIIDTTNEPYINKEINNLKARRMEYLKRMKCSSKLINEVENIPLYAYDKGCSIGNQTSQAFGLIYLNGLNHYMKEKLHLKYIVNYMDDIVILHQNKEYLKYCLTKIEKYLNSELELEINKNKTKINNIRNGIEFLGYRYLINSNNKLIIKLGNRCKKNFKKKVKEINKLKELKILNDSMIKLHFASYKGLFKYSNCNNFYYKYRRLIC